MAHYTVKTVYLLALQHNQRPKTIFPSAFQRTFVLYRGLVLFARYPWHHPTRIEQQNYHCFKHGF